jgi:hypothetical protein
MAQPDYEKRKPTQPKKGPYGKMENTGIERKCGK